MRSDGRHSDVDVVHASVVKMSMIKKKDTDFAVGTPQTCGHMECGLVTSLFYAIDERVHIEAVHQTCNCCKPDARKAKNIETGLEDEVCAAQWCGRSAHTYTLLGVGTWRFSWRLPCFKQQMNAQHSDVDVVQAIMVKMSMEVAWRCYAHKRIRGVYLGGTSLFFATQINEYTYKSCIRLRVVVR